MSVRAETMCFEVQQARDRRPRSELTTDDQQREIATDGEAKTCASLRARELHVDLHEGLKYTLERLGRDAMHCVFHLDAPGRQDVQRTREASGQ